MIESSRIRNGARLKLTPNMEDYLKAIYRLQQRAEGTVATNDVAAEMQTSPSSATTMVKALTRIGLADHTPYHGVRLTAAGERVALEVMRHHRLIERYLAEFLGFGWDEVHAEADLLEHALSERLEERLAERLGNPTLDPHGDPIPTRDGTIEQRALVALPSLAPGARGVVGRVATSDPEKLRYLAQLGLVPGAGVECLDVSPFGGPIFVRVDTHEHGLGLELAANVLVDVDDVGVTQVREKERAQ